MKNKFLNGYFNEPKSEAARKFVAGKLAFKSSEEEVKKLCDQIVEMGKLYRAVGENYIRVDIVRNEDHEKNNKPEFSMVRSTWSKDGSLKEKIEAYEAGQQVKTISPDPFDDDDGLEF